MKSILMSIKPKWIEKIASGEKTVEVRKTVPKCGTPFKVYMYCTNDRKETLNMANGKGFCEKGELYLNGNCYYPYTDGTLNGKVVGEFVCDEVYDLFPFGMGTAVSHNGKFVEPALFRLCTCLTDKEIEDYLGNSDGYGLHISDLKIYEKPKELSEFKKIVCVKGNYDCQNCPYAKPVDVNWKKWNCCIRKDTITRPPQSWQFVEEL